jgi:hypothetical protein
MLTSVATPHAGSAILSNPRYSPGIAEAMGLKYPDQESTRTERMIKSPLSAAVRQELNPSNPALVDLSNAFAPIAASMARIWTFIESNDLIFNVLENRDYGDVLAAVARKVCPRSQQRSMIDQVPGSDKVFLDTQYD